MGRDGADVPGSQGGDNTDTMVDRAREMDLEWQETLKQRSGGAGGCMELAEAIADMRDE